MVAVASMAVDRCAVRIRVVAELVVAVVVAHAAALPLVAEPHRVAVLPRAEAGRRAVAAAVEVVVAAAVRG